LSLQLQGLEPWEAGTYKPLIISVFPDYDRREIFISWYQDGQLVATAENRWNNPVSLAAPGQTVIRTGGSGFDILDELGVYYRDAQNRPSPVPRIFASHLQQRYGSRVFYADGFDSPHFSEELEDLEVYNQGEWELLFDRLGLYPGGLFHFPGINWETGTYSGVLTISPDSGGDLYFQLRRIVHGESILLTELPISSKSDNQIRFEVSPINQELILNGRSLRLSLEEADENDEQDARIFWALSNRGEGILFLNEVAIIKDPFHLAAAETGS
jgi:hypothetical protein